MAGSKYAVTSAIALNTLNQTPLEIGLSRAYAEGRRSFPSTTNPFTTALGYATTSAEYVCWQAGYDNRASGTYKYETQS